MRDFRGKSGGRDARGSEVGGRLVRVAGRLLLWGCVLLLLVRGIASVLDGTPSIRVPAQTVTVTQPARTAPSMARER
jgi:hypothetical protein